MYVLSTIIDNFNSFFLRINCLRAFRGSGFRLYSFASCGRFGTDCAAPSIPRLHFSLKNHKCKKKQLKDKNKLFVELCKEYGKPSKDSSYVEKNEAPDVYSHDYTWVSKNRVVSVTICREEWPYWLGGKTTYTSFALVTIQDSILQRKNLQSLSLK